jgi:hypothetical protein
VKNSDDALRNYIEIHKAFLFSNGLSYWKTIARCTMLGKEIIIKSLIQDLKTSKLLVSAADAQPLIAIVAGIVAFIIVCCVGFLILIVYRNRKRPPVQPVRAPSEEEELNWIDQWRKFNQMDFPPYRKQFFLDGKYLDDFARATFSHAKFELLVVNPYILKCNLSDALLDARRRGVKVQVITQRPHWRNENEKREREAYH